MRRQLRSESNRLTGFEAFNLANELGGAAVGIFSGFVAGLLGVSPGGILVPGISLALGMGQHPAQAVSLAAQLVPTSLSGVREFQKAGHALSWRWVLFIAFGFLVGTAAGALAAHHVADKPLRWLFVAYLLTLAVVVARKSRVSAKATDVNPTSSTSTSPMALFVIGVVAGGSSGLLGIGGGLAMTALLTSWLGFFQHQAQALSLTVSALPLGLPAVWIYADGPAELPWLTVVFVVTGLWIGTALGARAATRLHEKRLRQYFVALIVLMAIAMAYRAVGSL
ncbi:MAG: sulfite exporter TauE/SafE family protein [Sulfurifustaceae bacterium]